MRSAAAGFAGLSLGQVLRAGALPMPVGPVTSRNLPGFGRAKSVILIFLQGGPSHLDLWDPKPDAPDDVRSPFRTIPSVVPGMELTELLPRLATVTFALRGAAAYEAFRAALAAAVPAPPAGGAA